MIILLWVELILRQKKSRRHSERSEESPGRKRKRQEVRGVRGGVGAKLEWNLGEKWQNGGYRCALNDNSTVSRVLFSRQKRKHSGV